MMNSKGYELNFAEEKIIITKRFSKLAGVVGSNEYQTLITLRRDFPDWGIEIKAIKKKENKVSYSGLSIYKMKAAISYITKEKETEEVELFEKYVEIYKGQKGKYATLKKLFLDKYKDAYNALNATDMAEIDRLAKEFEDKEKGKAGQVTTAA